MRLSKSKLIEYNDICSWKFKLRHIDSIPEPRTAYSSYADAGTDFHEGVVAFFTSLNPFRKKLAMEEIKTVMKCDDLLIENFITKFIAPLLANCNNTPRYYFPVMTEQKIYNREMDFAGIVDAVFIHPQDGEYVLMDWKTGRPKSLQSMREESACYKFVIDDSGKLDKPIKYCAMFFVKTGQLFFEECTDEMVKKYKAKIQGTRKSIQEEKFAKNPKVCHFCGYSQKYGKFCDEGRA